MFTLMGLFLMDLVIIQFYFYTYTSRLINLITIIHVDSVFFHAISLFYNYQTEF